jgi:hypothetical protein
MANKQQQIFAKIVLHNKLLDAAELEQLLAEFSDPEEIIRITLPLRRQGRDKLHCASTSAEATVDGQDDSPQHRSNPLVRLPVSP